jgi:hypothetical protein
MTGHCEWRTLDWVHLKTFRIVDSCVFIFGFFPRDFAHVSVGKGSTREADVPVD